MLKLYLPNIDPARSTGGGWMFMHNFAKGVQQHAKLVTRWQDADAVLIGSPTIAPPNEVFAAADAGKKILLRVDNLPRNSRNEGKSVMRMREYAQRASVIVFQSSWAFQYVGTWLRACGVNIPEPNIIYNGVDTEFFHHADNPVTRGETYLYITASDDENKRWPEAFYDFYKRSMAARLRGAKRPFLRIIGRFPRNVIKNKFDFFNGENYKYTPITTNRAEISDAMRASQYLYFPAFADAAPNTVAEAIACGCEILLVNPIGGTEEVIAECKEKIHTIQDMAKAYCDLLR